MGQLSHYETHFKTRKFPITVVCDHVNKAPNIGSLFRICEAFGVETLYFCGNDIPIGRRMTKTSRATEKLVHYQIEESIEEVISALKPTHYLIALEITASSKPLHQIELETSKPLVLILGDENHGISETVLKEVDATFHIDMFGANSSMNVVQAASIALYELTKQLNETASNQN